MQRYKVAIVLWFEADDGEHAVEQFVDAVDDVAAWVNVVEVERDPNSPTGYATEEFKENGII